LFTPPAAVFVEVVKGRTLRKFELATDATAYSLKSVPCRKGKKMNLPNGSGRREKKFSRFLWREFDKLRKKRSCNLPGWQICLDKKHSFIPLFQAVCF
jgi:hypothetical protein